MTMDLSARELQRRVLPRGWRWAPLGDVADYLNGRAFKPEDWGGVGRPIIRIQNLNDIDAPFNRFAGQVEAKHAVEDGDLLISWSASLDAFIWKRGPAVLNQHIFTVEERPRLVTRAYLYLAAREAMAEIRANVHGATMRHITKPEFEAVQIPLPPIPEQIRIAERLNKQLAVVERAKTAAIVRLRAAQQLSGSLLQSALCGPASERWSTTPLNEIAELLPSKSVASDGDSEVRAVTTACLSEEGFRSRE